MNRVYPINTKPFIAVSVNVDPDDNSQHYTFVVVDDGQLYGATFTHRQIVELVKDKHNAVEAYNEQLHHQYTVKKCIVPIENDLLEIENEE